MKKNIFFEIITSVFFWHFHRYLLLAKEHGFHLDHISCLEIQIVFITFENNLFWLLKLGSPSVETVNPILIWIAFYPTLPCPTPPLTLTISNFHTLDTVNSHFNGFTREKLLFQAILYQLQIISTATEIDKKSHSDFFYILSFYLS